jgi:hypothetical protein
VRCVTVLVPSSPPNLDCSDGATVSCFWFLFFGSGSGVGGTLSIFSAFGESVALFVSISVGGGGLSFRSPIVWQLAAVDLLFLFLLRCNVGRWSFSAYDSSGRVGKAAAYPNPMFGAASRWGRWTCSEAGGRRRHVHTLISVCFLEDCMYFAYLSGCFSETG